MHESNSSPVITAKRRHSVAFKRKLLKLIERPGASVAGVALEHGVNANLVFKWRRAKHEHKRPAGTVLGDEGAGVKLAELAEAGDDG
jgi:transposase